MRSRTIKPGFFQNELLPNIDAMGRLLFIGLWTVADREGRLEDRPIKIKGQLFPYEDCPVDVYLTRLVQLGFIIRYQYVNNKYIQIVNFEKHQHIHVKEAPSTIPAPDKPGASPVQTPDENLSSTPLILNPSTLILNPISVPTVQVFSPDGENTLETVNGCPYQKIVALYHEILPDLPRCKKLTPARKAAIKQRHCEDMEHSLENWAGYFRLVGRSAFLTGKERPRIQGAKPFIADLEWITKQANYAKIYERKYHD